MAVNYFADKTQTWLETQLENAQSDFAAGKTITSVSSGDVASGKQIQVDVTSRIERLLYALYLLDPDTYPLASSARTSRTRIVAYQG